VTDLSANGSDREPVETPAGEPLLVVDAICAGYRDLQVLWNVSLSVTPGRVTALLGRNGAGKTTTLRAIAGLNPLTKGSVRYRGQEINTLSAHARARDGIALVQEGKRIFRRRTVQENLLLGGYGLGLRRKQLIGVCDRAYERFPILATRRKGLAGQLSGGQQQMLAIAQALLSEPKVLMLDEPSAGLAPSIVKDVFETIRGLSGEGLAVLLVEQAVDQALQIADQVAVLDVGRVVVNDSTEGAGSASVIREAYLGRLS